MKSFKFSLQSIRILREQKERTAQQRFADAMRACEEAAFHLQKASDELASGWSSLCEELSAGVTATGLSRTRCWCDVLESRQKEGSAALDAARRCMNAAWREMMVATRDRQVLDSYHDKCRRSYNRDAQREEQKRLDELGIRRAAVPGMFPTAPRLAKGRL
jgi:flagellar export protein FliJ